MPKPARGARLLPPILLPLLLGVAAAQQPEPPGVGPGAGQEPDLFERLLDEAPASRPYGSTALLVQIHGFLNFEYVDVDGQDSEFDLHHANLFISGTISEQLEAYIEVEYEHASETIELDQAEMRYRPFVDRDLTLAAGRFYAPFGIERRTWYPSGREFVSRPNVFRSVVPGNWYETGIRADYRHTLGEVTLQGELAVTNGLGPTANTDVRAARQMRDADNSRAVIGRLAVEFADGPALGVSGATMNYDGQNSIDFVGVDFEQTVGPVLLRAEWVHSAVEDPAGPVGDFDRSGLYVLGSYRAWSSETQSVDLSLRFDRIDPNSRLDDGNDVDVWSAAVRFVPTPHLAVKFEYQRQDGVHGIDPASADAFFAQFVVDF